MRVLAGDIGGTHSRIACFEADGERLRAVAEQIYDSASYDGLSTIVADFSARHGGRCEHACFGIAGPVREGVVRATNLPWVIDAAQLASELKLRRVSLINDLEAIAYSIAVLDPDQLVTLNPAADASAGNAAIIAAGTGLGESGLYWDGATFHPFACEGGHADFSPADELQDELLRYLRPQFGHVSWERVLSGPGLYALYRFLRDSGRGTEPEWLGRELAQQDASRQISRHALAGTDALCAQALDLFVTLYGSEAGNLALKLMARGGVYVGGGIAPQIIERLRSPAFMGAFRAKGRMGVLLDTVPVRVILDDKTGLLGAARCAALRAAD